MPDSITLITFLVFLFWAFVLGLGWSIGAWLWSVIVAVLSRGRTV